jgi:hypothetical protein
MSTLSIENAPNLESAEHAADCESVHLPSLSETSRACRRAMHRLLMLSDGVPLEMGQLLRLLKSLGQGATKGLQ